jgi:hypothetical protein
MTTRDGLVDELLAGALPSSAALASPSSAGNREKREQNNKYVNKE